MKILIRLTYYALLLSLSLNSGVARAALDPFKIGLGARSIAMGRTAAAMDKDLNSIFINPANAASIEGLGLSSMYTNLSEEINYKYLAVENKFRFGNFGLAYLSAGSGGFTSTSLEAGRVVSTGNAFDYSSSLLCLTYGKEIRNNLAWGASLKYFNRGYSNLPNGTGSGFDLDLGILWKPKDNFKIGLAQQNLLPSSIANINWGTGTKEDIPANTRLGFSLVPRNDWLLAADLDYLSNNPLVLHAGLEWKVKPWLELRGGIDQLATGSASIATNYTLGVGLNYRDFSFDYAYYYDSVLSSTNSAHYFSLSYAFQSIPSISVPKAEEKKLVVPTPPVKQITPPKVPKRPKPKFPAKTTKKISPLKPGGKR